MSNTWHVYSLTDPRDGRVRYIGKTGNTKKRLGEHVREAVNSRTRNYRLNWVRAVLESGNHPQLSILESGEGDWAVAERKWIKNFRDAGYALVNGNDGGEGGLNPSAETRAKLSAAQKGHKVSEKCRAKMSAANKRRKHSAETRAKMSIVKRNISAETRAKMSAACKGRKFSAETRAKIGAAAKGRQVSPETRAKLSASHKGLKPSAETRAKLSASHKGHKPSVETRAKLSAATKAFRAKRKQEPAV